jgi:hypothetical protein
MYVNGTASVESIPQHRQDAFLTDCFTQAQYRMHRFLKQKGTRKVKLSGTGKQKGGLFGESTGPVDNVPSDAPLRGNRKCTDQGVSGQPTGCSSAVRLAVRNEGDQVGSHARPLTKCLLIKRNKQDVKCSALAAFSS